MLGLRRIESTSTYYESVCKIIVGQFERVYSLKRSSRSFKCSLSVIQRSLGDCGESNPDLVNRRLKTARTLFMFSLHRWPTELLSRTPSKGESRGFFQMLLLPKDVKKRLVSALQIPRNWKRPDFLVNILVSHAAFKLRGLPFSYFRGCALVLPARDWPSNANRLTLATTLASLSFYQNVPSPRL